MKQLGEAQQERVDRIKLRWFNREYKRQADSDIRFLLRMITGEDPDLMNNKKKGK